MREIKLKITRIEKVREFIEIGIKKKDLEDFKMNWFWVYEN